MGKIKSNKELDYKPYTVKWIDDENNVENWLVDGTLWDTMVDMAEEKANNRSIEIWTRSRDKNVEDELLYSRLSSIKQKELDAIMGDMVDTANKMVEDFVDNPSELRGEIDFDKRVAYGDGIRIHSNSPQLDEDDESWKSMDELVDDYMKEAKKKNKKNN